MQWPVKAWSAVSALIVGALAVCAWRLPSGYTVMSVGDIVQTLLPIALTIAMAANALKSSGRTRAFWAIAGSGAALWAIANASWMQYEVFLRKPVPVPFIGDVLFFLHIVPFTAAIAVRPHRKPSDDQIQIGGVDFLMLLTWWVYLYLFLVIPWQYVAADRATYSLNFNVLYSVENAVLVVGCALLALRARGPWRTIYANLFGASALYLFGSQLVNNAITRDVYYTGSLYDLALVVAMCWLIGIAIHALSARPQALESKGTKWHALIMARLAMLATLSMPVICLLGNFIYRPAQHSVVVFRLCVTLGGMFVLPFLLFLKQHLLDRELVRLLAVSEHSLVMERRLQAQLVQTEKLSSLSYLVAGAAHEINNPLTAILGYADLLQTDASLMPHSRQFAKKIGDQARRTKELVGDLLKFGQQAPAQKETVDLNSIMANAIELRKLDLPANVTIIEQLDPLLPAVPADPNQMLQVCFDIIGNAVDALVGIGGGTVTIRTSAENGAVTLAFKDSGPGVKNMSNIFDPFYTTKPVGQGTGLKLSAAYGIVREHGGLITCDNDAQGGATFKIMLPLVPSAAPKPTPPDAPKPAARAAIASH